MRAPPSLLKLTCSLAHLLTICLPACQVWDPERVVIIPDHYIFTSDPRANRNVDILREMASKYNIKYFYDILDRSDFRANPNYKGVCHVALAQVRGRKRRVGVGCVCVCGGGWRGGGYRDGAWSASEIATGL